MTDEVNARPRVAYDLMKRIAERERADGNTDAEAFGQRSYWLALYHQCFAAVHGQKPG